MMEKLIQDCLNDILDRPFGLLQDEVNHAYYKKYRFEISLEKIDNHGVVIIKHYAPNCWKSHNYAQIHIKKDITGYQLDDWTFMNYFTMQDNIYWDNEEKHNSFNLLKELCLELISKVCKKF